MDAWQERLVIGVAETEGRVCELLLAAFRAKKGQRLVRVIGKGTTGRRNLAGAAAMNQRDGQIAKGRQNLWAVAATKTRAVFLEADIADVMGAIFDSPMASNQAE